MGTRKNDNTLLRGRGLRGTGVDGPYPQGVAMATTFRGAPMTMNLNTAIFEWIHSGAGTRPVMDALAVFFGKGGPFMVAVLFVVLWFIVGKQRKLALLEATWAAVLGLAVNQAIGLFYFHPRPYMVGLGEPLFPHGPENSFPSDHATIMFAAPFYLLFARRWAVCGFPLLVLTLLTAWGRVYAGVHFPFDMIGSLVVGFVSAAFARLAATSLQPVNERLIRVIGRLTPK